MQKIPTEYIEELGKILSHFGTRQERARSALACYVVLSQNCLDSEDGFWLLDVNDVEKSCGVSVRTQYRVYRELEELGMIYRRSERRGKIRITYVHVGPIDDKKPPKDEPSDRTGFWQVKEYLKSINYEDRLNYSKLEELYKDLEPQYIIKQVIKAVDWRNAKRKAKYLTTSQLFVFLDNKKNGLQKPDRAAQGKTQKGSQRLHESGGGYNEITL